MCIYIYVCMYIYIYICIYIYMEGNLLNCVCEGLKSWTLPGSVLPVPMQACPISFQLSCFLQTEWALQLVFLNSLSFRCARSIIFINNLLQCNQITITGSIYVCVLERRFLCV
uniref:Uncharacterized protein n=1 Tax=Octopus bimaculoides TaxID=37653 RepID=A0A0L8FG77_OCTBM